MSEGEKKEKRDVKPVEASPALIAAIKRDAEGKASVDDLALIAHASDGQRRAGRKAAGIKSRRGGFRTNVDMYVKRVGEDAARKVPKADWKSFGELKKEVVEKGQKVTIALVPHGASLK